MFESYSFATSSASSVPCVSSNRKTLVLIWCLNSPLQVVRGGAVGDRHLGGTAVPGHVQRTSAALRHGGRPPGQTRQLPRHAVSPSPPPTAPLPRSPFQILHFYGASTSPLVLSPFNFERGSILSGGPERSCGADGEVEPEMSPDIDVTGLNAARRRHAQLVAREVLARCPRHHRRDATTRA